MPAGLRTRPLRVLVVAHSLTGSVRFIGPVVSELLARGHSVHVALEPPRRKHEGDPWLEAMAGEERFSWGIVDAWRRDPWFAVAKWLRRSDDYLRYLLVGRERVPYFVERAEGRAPRATQALLGLPLLSSRPVVRLLSQVLTAFDAAVPTSRGAVEFVRGAGADVVVVMPILMPGSTDSAYLRASAAAGVPTLLSVPSWDNLSSKQLIRVPPDALVVWNETQRAEAGRLHGVPPERVVVTGAQNFDHWFVWEPRTRATFCEHVGLDPERPYLLYAGGALFPGTETEPRYARRWIEGLRSSGVPELREVGVLVRPHPKRLGQWHEVRFDDLDGVVVWPRGEMRPTGADADADYFDSIFHSAAVVGVNTTAMIEAAIVARPVYTQLVPSFHASQRGTLHFDYVLDLAGGFVNTSESDEQHHAQLAALLRGEVDGGVEAERRFVADFVRPHGLEQAATPVFADAIESVAAAGVAAGAADGGTPILRLLLLPALTRVQLRRVYQKLAVELLRRVRARAAA